MKKLVYIAAPYSHNNPAIKEFRFKVVLWYARIVFGQPDYIAFSPVLHCIHFEQTLGLAGSFDTWEDFCLRMLRHADELHVLTIPGWITSVGVEREVEEAERLGIQIRCVRGIPAAELIAS